MPAGPTLITLSSHFAGRIDSMADYDRRDVALLLRRAAFWATGAEIDAAASAGYAATVDSIVASVATGEDAASDAVSVPELTVPTPPGRSASAAERTVYNQQLRDQAVALITWWVTRMIVTGRPAAEKLVWFWHTHFATGLDK